MQKKLTTAVMALCVAAPSLAQTDDAKAPQATGQDTQEAAFTFTEAQLGEDDDMAQNVTIINSNSNLYANQVGYLFSPVRFRYRAFNQKYNDVYINGAPMNDMETGQFRYSLVGGLNQQTKNMDYALPFETPAFAMPGMGGANNYDFRAGHMPAGHRITLTGANRNYTLRGMYTYASGFNERGWAVAANLTYRWANRGYVEGTFYNSLSYYLGIQKLFAGGRHSIAFATWGNPTERASQGAATDEAYWLANDNQYNPYWGYQNGKKRNSRVVNDFAPTALLTWDWQIDEHTKLTTTLQGRYSMYKSTKLNYNNSDNPQPNYWKNLPSSYYDVWAGSGTASELAQWQEAYDFWTASKENRQINWDRLYWANRQVNTQGADAMYYIQAKHNDNLNLALSSVLNKELGKKDKWALGLTLASNTGKHYLTMEDMLGAEQFHNINTYALGTYATDDPRVQYDLNNPNASVGVGDKFQYDYNLLVNKGQLWSSWKHNSRMTSIAFAGRLAVTTMQRDGKMRNGLAADNSYGKSGTATFVDGGGKFSAAITPNSKNTFNLGVSFEWRAPQASTAFVAPEINNDFVGNLKNEKAFSSELGYMFSGSWLHANLTGYYSRITDATDWQNFYYDDINSFSYVSIPGLTKEYYGAELGLKFRLASFLDLKMLGTMAEAKILNNATANYMKSTSGDIYTETLYCKDMRESGTPLTATSIGLSYHQGGWFIDLNANYYDRIYLSYSPSYRYESEIKNRNKMEGGVPQDIEQAKGKGGWMLDASIGRSIYLKRGSLSINLSLTNVLNNQRLCTGGYEQSRSDNNSSGSERTYKFSKNPMKFYAYGINGMLNIAYKF